jgi:hypothetical protein
VRWRTNRQGSESCSSHHETPQQVTCIEFQIQQSPKREPEIISRATQNAYPASSKTAPSSWTRKLSPKCAALGTITRIAFSVLATPWTLHWQQRPAPAMRAEYPAAQLWPFQELQSDCGSATRQQGPYADCAKTAHPDFFDASLSFTDMIHQIALHFPPHPSNHNNGAQIEISL